ncbi:MAG: polysaccharide biosynthesis tyrosine autokinase [Bacteroidia bacterium]|nr:polysaccharide biosynthesis tyrosine autokinase [Bacteroidia bacterium]
MAATEEELIPESTKRRKPKKLSTFDEEFDLGLFSLIARRNLKWVGLIFIVGAILAFVYLRYAPRWYEESTTIQLSFANNANKVLQNSNGLYEAGDDELEAAVELMRSKLFLERIFNALPMIVSYYTEGTFKDHQIYHTTPLTVTPDSNARKYLKGVRVYLNISEAGGGQLAYKFNDSSFLFPFNNGQWTDVHYGKIKVQIQNLKMLQDFNNRFKKNSCYFVINDSVNLADEFYPLITVTLLNPEAKTIKISCRNVVDRVASDIVNEMAQEYIKFDLEKRRKSAENVLNFIDEQLNTVYGRIKTSEEQLDTMHKVKKTDEQVEYAKQNISHLFTLDDQVSSAAEEVKLLNYVRKEIENSKDIDPTGIISLLSGSDYGSAITEYLTTLHHLVTERQQLSYDVTAGSPQMTHLNTQIADESKLITQSLDAIIQRINSKKEDLEAEADRIKSQYLVAGSSANNIEYLRLQHLFSIDEKYYDDLLDKKTQFSLDKAGYVPQSQVLETAVPTQIPVAPKRSTTFIVAGLSSASASLILLVIIYLFYNEVNSVEEIERLAESSVNMLGIVPRYDKEIPVSQLVINHYPKSALAESFRSLRTKLQFIRTGSLNPKVIALTSTIPGEGKTFVAINLAGIIAYSGKKVIMLDLDMRKPRIHAVLGLDNCKGMSTLLIGKDTIAEVVQKTETAQLDVIPAGPIPPNPSELVISKEMDQILEKLKEQYDTIIIDNPPVGLVTDGIAMLQKADYPLYVMRAGYSKREFIHFIDRLYFENNFHSLSIILNGVNLKAKSYGYGYGMKYGTGTYYEA